LRYFVLVFVLVQGVLWNNNTLRPIPAEHRTPFRGARDPRTRTATRHDWNAMPMRARLRILCGGQTGPDRAVSGRSSTAFRALMPSRAGSALGIRTVASGPGSRRHGRPGSRDVAGHASRARGEAVGTGTAHRCARRWFARRCAPTGQWTRLSIGVARGPGARRIAAPEGTPVPGSRARMRTRALTRARMTGGGAVPSLRAQCKRAAWDDAFPRTRIHAAGPLTDAGEPSGAHV